MSKLLFLVCLSTLGHMALALLVNSSSKSVRVNLRAHSSVHQALKSACGRSPSFSQFIATYDRTYTNEEYSFRRSLFDSRVADIEAQNCRTTDRLWHATVNVLTDRTDQELAAMRGRSRTYADAEVPIRSSLLQTPERRSPTAESNLADKTVTYRHLEAMLHINDQGSCGSCWAQGTTTMLWAHAQIYQDVKAPFSVNQLVACVPNPEACGGTGGCQGATAELAMDYVYFNGLKTDSNWTGGHYTCAAADKPKNARPIPQPTSEEGAGGAPGLWNMLGWEKLPENKQEPLMRAVYERGPVAVSVAAGPSWNGYGSGIMDSCSKDGIINHLVVLVGFGNEHGKHYWTIQNSWGSGWGEQGFMRLLREKDETSHCGWDYKPEDGTACKGGPSKVKICGMCGILYDSVVPHFKGSTKAAMMMLERRKE